MNERYGSASGYPFSRSEVTGFGLVPPSWIAGWIEQRRLRRTAALYVQTLLEEPDASDVAWLSDVATRGDADRARWELRYARRAAGLLSAERDALDDRTASAVARELGESWLKDRNIAADKRHTAEQQFNARLRALGQALTARSSPEPTATRLGRALLFTAGQLSPRQEDIERGGTIVARYLERANEALRKEFGTATLPENVAPSALAPGHGAQASRR